MKLFILSLVIVQIIALQTQCNKVDPATVSELYSTDQLIYSGYLNVKTESESALAFIFYGNKDAKTVDQLKNKPTLIWLNGLLGESSQIGNFIELGPVIFDSNGALSKNANTWTSQFNVLFVDLVVGIGYSYLSDVADIPYSGDELSTQFLYAVDQFIKADNGCVKKQAFTGLDTSDWYIFGEGYAAKQIVHIATKALDTQSTTLHTQLKGIGLGNAHIDATSLLAEIPSYAFSLGLVEPRERQQLEKLGLRGIKQIENKQYLAAHQTIQEAIGYIHQFSGGINIQNIDQLTDIEKVMSSFAAYLKLNDTKTAFHFDPTIEFKQSSNEILGALSQDFAKLDALPKLKDLQTKLKVLVYTGQNDVLCPISSTLRYLAKINDDFKTKQLAVQVVNKLNVGYTLTTNKLTFVSVNNAGFHIPREKGDVILPIVQEWIK